MPPIEDRLPEWDTIFTPRVIANLVRLAWLSLSIWLLVASLRGVRAAEAIGDRQGRFEAELGLYFLLLYLDLAGALVGGVFATALLQDPIGPFMARLLGVSTGTYYVVLMWTAATVAGYVQWFMVVPRLARWTHGIYRRRRAAADRRRGWS